MPTLLQQKLAKRIIEVDLSGQRITKQALLESVSYGKISKQPSRVLKSKGVQEVLAEYGFSEDNAKKVVAKILLSDKSKDENKLKASDQIFKVRGSYAPERHINLDLVSSVSSLTTEELEKLAYSEPNNENEANNDVLQAP